MGNRNHITNLEIKNFKSIKSLKAECARVNIFIGEPNSGKSNILEALSLFSVPYMEKGLEDTFGGNLIRYEQISNLFYNMDITKPIEIKSSIGYGTLRWHKGLNFYDLVFSSYKTLLKKALLSTTYHNYIKELKQHFKEPVQNELPITPYLLTFKNDGKFANNDFDLDYVTPIKKYDFNTLFTGEVNNTYVGFLLPSGANLFSVIQINKELKQFASDLFKKDKLQLLLDQSANRIEIQRKIKDVVYKIPFELIADTYQRLIYNVAAIESNSDSILLFEEPESHSFPPYIQKLCDKISESVTNQFFITTHSPYFINHFLEEKELWPEISIFNVYYEGFQTKFKKLTDNDINRIWGSGTDVFFNLRNFRD